MPFMAPAPSVFAPDYRNFLPDPITGRFEAVESYIGVK
jgi:hypothetical protein